MSAQPLRKIDAEAPHEDRADAVIMLLEVVEHIPKQHRDHNFTDAQTNNALTSMQFCLANNPTPGELQKLAAYVELSTVIPEGRRKVLAWLLRRVSAGELSVAVGAITIKSMIDAANQDAIERTLREAIDRLDKPLDRITAAIRGEKES